MKKLTSKQISKLAITVHDWRLKWNSIDRVFVFKDFNKAMKFVDKIALIAEKNKHHPDIDIRWNKVRLELTTHDQGGLTKIDFLIAKKADNLFADFV